MPDSLSEVSAPHAPRSRQRNTPPGPPSSGRTRLRYVLCAATLLAPLGAPAAPSIPSRVRIAPDGRGFTTPDGRPFTPFGVNYYRPGTGWAPQVWKQFDPEATRRDFIPERDLDVLFVTPLPQ